MASLTLKNLPDPLLRDLRKAAKKDRRSLTQEIVYLLDAGLRSRIGEPGPRAAYVEEQLAVWRKLAGKWKSDLERGAEAKQLMKRRTPGRKVAL